MPADVVARDPGGGAPVVRCRDLSVARRGAQGWQRVVDGVDMRLAAGEALAVFGDGSSGAAELGMLLSGRGHPGLDVDGGDADVAGVAVGRGRRTRALLRWHVGYVGAAGSGAGPTSHAPLTVERIVTAPLIARRRPHGLDGRALSLRVAGLLEEVGLPLGAAAAYPYELSGAARRQVAVARALMLDPAVLVVDGLSRSMDPSASAAILAALARRRHRGLAVLLTSARAATARALEAAILVLDAGRPVAAGRHPAALSWARGVPRSLRDRAF